MKHTDYGLGETRHHLAMSIHSMVAALNSKQREDNRTTQSSLALMWAKKAQKSLPLLPSFDRLTYQQRLALRAVIQVLAEGSSIEEAITKNAFKRYLRMREGIGNE